MSPIFNSRMSEEVHLDRRMEQFVETGRTALVQSLRPDDIIVVRNRWMQELSESLALVVAVNLDANTILLRKRHLKAIAWGHLQTVPFDDFLRIEARV